MNKIKENFILPSERVLEDDYPVYYQYVYVADGIVIRSNIYGIILDLKKDLRSIGLEAIEIRNCDIFERQKKLKNES